MKKLHNCKDFKIGLVLGGGGVRGYAHLGALKAIYEAGIKIDFIVGTSFGALVGAGYAAGHNIYELEKIAHETGWIKILKMVNIILPRGIFSKKKVEKFFSIITQQKYFSDLEIPLTIVATDIETGDEILINKGPVSNAILASSAFPGVLSPVEIDNRRLVDGVLVNPLPIQTAFDLGADLVIAVDVSSSTEKNNHFITLIEYSKNLLQNIYQIPYLSGAVSLRRISNKVHSMLPGGFKNIGHALRVVKNNKNKIVFIHSDCNVAIIKPKVENIRWYDFRFSKRCIELGAEAVDYTTLEDIRDLSFNYKTIDLNNQSIVNNNVH
jgi:NTE family protein